MIAPVKYALATLLLLSSLYVSAKDEVELETTYIRGNTELPQVLYVIPWKDMKQEANKQEVIVLHSLFGDLFEPVIASDLEQ